MKGAPPNDVPPGTPQPRGLRGLAAKVRAWADRYGAMLWWAHSLYALGLGLLVVFFADKGFAHARWLAALLALVWILLVVFFRVFGGGSEQDAAIQQTKGGKVKFVLVTYLIKNLYQGMLFFVLPFYWKSTTFDSPNAAFVFLLCLCALVATLDVVFDKVIMRARILASLFYAFTLFACLNLIVPAFMPNTALATAMMVAAGLTVLAFVLMHVSLQSLRKPAVVGAILAATGFAVVVAQLTRTAVPPVPMYLTSAAVGPKLLPDGRLAMEVSTVHSSYVKKLHAVTDIAVPGGVGDLLFHVWRHDGKIVASLANKTERSLQAEGVARLRSRLSSKQIPKAQNDRVGAWSVDVVTADGQLVGRFGFEVTR